MSDRRSLLLVIAIAAHALASAWVRFMFAEEFEL